MILMQSHER